MVAMGCAVLFCGSVISLESVELQARTITAEIARAAMVVFRVVVGLFMVVVVLG